MSGAMLWVKLLRAVDQSKSGEVGEILKDPNCRLSIKTKMGNTVLHRAAKNGSMDIVQMLLDANADPTATNNAGWTPVHEAAFCGNDACVELLIAAGGDESARNYDGVGALVLARMRGHDWKVRAAICRGIERKSMTPPESRKRSRGKETSLWAEMRANRERFQSQQLGIPNRRGILCGQAAERNPPRKTGKLADQVTVRDKPVQAEEGQPQAVSGECARPQTSAGCIRPQTAKQRLQSRDVCRPSSQELHLSVLERRAKAAARSNSRKLPPPKKPRPTGRIPKVALDIGVDNDRPSRGALNLPARPNSAERRANALRGIMESKPGCGDSAAVDDVRIHGKFYSTARLVVNGQRACRGFQSKAH